MIQVARQEIIYGPDIREIRSATTTTAQHSPDKPRAASDAEIIQRNIYEVDVVPLGPIGALVICALVLAQIRQNDDGGPFFIGACNPRLQLVGTRAGGCAGRDRVRWVARNHGPV